MGATLHLRPWSRLQRRDLGALLRHELAHRRLQGRGWPRWQEEALCLWAEGHTRLPEPLPPAPEARVQARLDRALQGGTTASQRWAYAWLRAWLAHQPLPAPPGALTSASGGWAPEGGDLRVLWSPERLPGS